MKSNFERLEFLDFSLNAVASCLAVYSLGMALHAPVIGTIFMVIAVSGNLVSYFLHRNFGAKLIVPAGILYAVVGICCFVFRAELNGLLPEEGVPIELLTAGALGWMISACSFFLWRDATLIFQAVPTIALFGLIGAWDTFSAAPFAFFGFLLCFATLFARTHGRLMMHQADEAGFDGGLDVGTYEEGPKVERFLGSLKAGPWRWMAGPEWALASALAVVCLSLLGAPVLQRSVQGMVNTVRINVPSPRNSSTEVRTDAFRSAPASSTTTIGNGPRSLENIVLFRTNLLEPTYLRSHTYDRYIKRGWSMTPNWSGREELVGALGDPKSLFNLMLDVGDNMPRFNYRVDFERIVDDSLPIPGIPDQVGDSRSLRVRPDLTVEMSAPDRRMSFAVRYSDNGFPSHQAGKNLPPVYSNADGDTKIPPRVLEFARRAASTGRNDYQKATLIKQAIEKQIVYDLQAPAVPDGQDPVDFVLFESRRGYCDLFASSMVLCARAVGLPARYVTGFYPSHNETDPRGGLIVHESEAHAWCEIYFEDTGWTPFDPTEGAAELGHATASNNLFQSGAGKTILVVIAALSLAVVPYGVVRYLKGRSFLADQNRAGIGRAYDAFTSHMEHLTGKVRRPSHTPEEYLAIVGPLLGSAYEDSERLTGEFVRALYSPQDGDFKDLKSQVTQFRMTHKRTR